MSGSAVLGISAFVTFWLGADMAKRVPRFGAAIMIAAAAMMLLAVLAAVAPLLAETK